MVHMDILSILPSAWLPVLTYIVAGLIALLALVGLLAGALLTARGYLGTSSPTDGPWKRRALVLAQWADPVALYAKSAMSALVLFRRELELQAAKRALAQAHAALAKQAEVIDGHEVTIAIQQQAISASMPPPPEPPK